MYPSQVPIDEKVVERLTTLYKRAYGSIVKEISTATNFGVANRKAILRQIEETLTTLGVDIKDVMEKELTDQYKIGANEAIDQLRNVGADIGTKEGFNRLHREAIAALVDDSAKAFGETLTGVQRSANLLLGKTTRELITQKLGEGMIGGNALKEVRNNIKGILQEQGLDALVDKAGHRWELDRYAEMLIRTKSVEARNRGLINRMVENDYDLVQVSEHSGSCDICSDWEGEILSATGATPGYPTVADAEADGLFHPNCRHAINTLIPSLANKTNAYDNSE